MHMFFSSDILNWSRNTIFGGLFWMREIFFHNSVYLFVELASMLVSFYGSQPSLFEQFPGNPSNFNWMNSITNHYLNKIPYYYHVWFRGVNANKAVSIFGYTVEELIHKSFVPIIVPEDVEPTMNNFHQAISGVVTTYDCAILIKKETKKIFK